MKLFYRRLYFLTLQRTGVKGCVVINNHSVAIEGNAILFNCSQGLTHNFGISQPISHNIIWKRYKNLETECMTTSSGLPYFSIAISRSIETWRWLFLNWIRHGITLKWKLVNNIATWIIHSVVQGWFTYTPPAKNQIQSEFQYFVI